MVDPTSTVGPASGLIKTLQEYRDKSEEKIVESEPAEKANSPKDEVVISQEALDLVEAQAEEASKKASAALAQNPDQSLGIDPDFDKIA